MKILFYFDLQHNLASFFVGAISIIGVWRYQKPTVILFHCDREPVSAYWKAAKLKCGKTLKIVRRSPPRKIYGNSLRVSCLTNSKVRRNFNVFSLNVSRLLLKARFTKLDYKLNCCLSTNLETKQSTNIYTVLTAAILSSIFCSHYGFLRILIQNNLFSAPIAEKNSLFFINITTRQQFFISVSESTNNMLKQRFANFFQIKFEIESMNLKPLASFIKQKPA